MLRLKKTTNNSKNKSNLCPCKICWHQTWTYVQLCVVHSLCEMHYPNSHAASSFKKKSIAPKSKLGALTGFPLCLVFIRLDHFVFPLACLHFFFFFAYSQSFRSHAEPCGEGSSCRGRGQQAAHFVQIIMPGERVVWFLYETPVHWH